MNFLRPLLVSALILLLPASAVRAVEPESPALALQSAWDRLSALDYVAALERFEALEATATETRWREAASYGAAVTLLNLPPTTPARLAAAAARLEQLWRHAEWDYVKVAAGFLLARYWQLHAPEVNWARADALYAEVARMAPSSRYGQLAFVQRAVTDIFGELRTPAATRERIAYWLAGADAVVDPVMRRNFLLCISAAQLWFKAASPAEILPILQDAWAGGFMRFDMQQVVLRRIGFTAERAGDLETAVTIWRQLADNYPRDNNRQFYLDRIRQIAAGELLSPPTP